jgi:hypothetical protein
LGYGNQGLRRNTNRLPFHQNSNHLAARAISNNYHTAPTDDQDAALYFCPLSQELPALHTQNVFLFVST